MQNMWDHTLEGCCRLHVGVSRVCEMLPLLAAAAMALMDSGQRPRPALLHLVFAGGAALTRVNTVTKLRSAGCRATAAACMHCRRSARMLMAPLWCCSMRSSTETFNPMSSMSSPAAPRLFKWHQHGTCQRSRQDQPSQQECCSFETFLEPVPDNSSASHCLRNVLAGYTGVCAYTPRRGSAAAVWERVYCSQSDHSHGAAHAKHGNAALRAPGAAATRASYRAAGTDRIQDNIILYKRI